MLSWDFDGEGCWTAYSCIGDEDSSFEWQIYVCEDGTFGARGSIEELAVLPDYFKSLDEAKEHCEQQERQYISELKGEE